MCVTERVPSNCTRLWHQFYIVAKLCNYSITLAQKTVFHKLPMLWKKQHTFVHMYHCCTCSECTKQILQIGNKRPPWHLDEVVRIWWPRVRGQSHCDLTNHIFGHNSRIHIIITMRFDIQMCNRIKWWSHGVWYPKGQRLNALWHHYNLQKIVLAVIQPHSSGTEAWLVRGAYEHDAVLLVFSVITPRKSFISLSEFEPFGLKTFGKSREATPLHCFSPLQVSRKLRWLYGPHRCLIIYRENNQSKN